MNKTSTKTLITLLVVLISFIFIVEFTSPIQSINIGHLQKRQDPAPPPDNPPPKDNPPPPPKDNPSPPPKDNPSPPPKDNPSPPPKDDPPPESPAPPKDNPTTAPQPVPETTTPPTPDPNVTPSSPTAPAPNPNATPPTPDPNATPPTPDPNATPTPTPSPNTPAPNPNATPPTPDPNAPTTTGPSSSPNSGVSSPTVSQSTTTSYLPGREPCTKVDDPRCQRGTTDPTVVSTTEQNEIITQPSTPPPTKSQSQLAPNPKKSTITQFTTYTTTETLFFPGYSTVTSSKGTNGELTTYATYIPPSTVVVVKKVTSAKVEEIQETNPSSAGHLDLELSVYNLYSVATSLFVITVTMLYLIVA